MSWAALEKHAPALSLLLQAARAADKARGNPPRTHLTPARRTRPYGGLASSSLGCIVARNLGAACSNASIILDEPAAAAIHKVLNVELLRSDFSRTVRFPEPITELILAFDEGHLPELVETT